MDDTQDNNPTMTVESRHHGRGFTIATGLLSVLTVGAFVADANTLDQMQQVRTRLEHTTTTLGQHLNGIVDHLNQMQQRVTSTETLLASAQDDRQQARIQVNTFNHDLQILEHLSRESRHNIANAVAVNHQAQERQAQERQAQDQANEPPAALPGGE